MEWKLFDPANPPQVADPAWLRKQPWMRLEGQPGFPERASMVYDLVNDVLRWQRPAIDSVTDLGCGDGAMLRFLQTLLSDAGISPASITGHDIGAGDIEHATRIGPYVYHLTDITTEMDAVQLGDLNIMTEVLEHMVDPLGFLRDLYLRLRNQMNLGGWLVATSPSAETDEWHNDIHLWAWDMSGYQHLFGQAGWEIIEHQNIAGGDNTFHGITRPQFFQGIVAVAR